MAYDLSILIPARNEMFLEKTVENILKNIRGNTEVIVGLDGAWANPPLEEHERLTVVYFGESIGQRAATNRLCDLSTAKYVMKIDAHCAVDEGFDVKMMEEMQDDITMIPTMYNLHGFNWVCTGKNAKYSVAYTEDEAVLKMGCGHTIYQGPTPASCEKCGGNMVRLLVWKPRLSRKSEFYRFDTTLHFQYHGERKKQVNKKDILVETMSAQGSCFMLTREKYWELNICDEKHGSWGQQGTEVACKTWLSGGRLLTNRKTWYSHMFRTQGGDFGFPYDISNKQVATSRKYSRELFMENTWDKQIYPLSWLIEKFKPLPEWHEEKGEKMLEYVNNKGKEFYLEQGATDRITEQDLIKGLSIMRNPITVGEVKLFNKESIKRLERKLKGIIYYTDNKVNMYLGHKVRKQILKSKLPVVSASLKPMDFGKNIHIKLERGYEAYFRQILAALEASTADIIFFCEHDWLYHPSHFCFTPEDRHTFYYNDNWWRVRASDGHAVRYDTHLLPSVVGYRELFIEYYRLIIGKLEKLGGFTGENARFIGFEPGTHHRLPDFEKYKVKSFKSEYPNIDIRHDTNLTTSKWSQSEFRSQRNCRNWQETDDIPGWGKVKGNFINLLKSI